MITCSKDTVKTLQLQKIYTYSLRDSIGLLLEVFQILQLTFSKKVGDKNALVYGKINYRP